MRNNQTPKLSIHLVESHDGNSMTSSRPYICLEVMYETRIVTIIRVDFATEDHPHTMIAHAPDNDPCASPPYFATPFDLACAVWTRIVSLFDAEMFDYAEVFQNGDISLVAE
jgi:hypothetical protein